MQVTLKPTNFKNSGALAFPGYISNGHWLIRKECVGNAALFDNIDSIRAFLGKHDSGTSRLEESNKRAESIIAQPPNMVEFFKTPLLLESYRTLARIYRSSSGEIAGIDEEYVKLFSLGSLFGTNGDSPFYALGADELPEIVVMPTRQTAETLQEVFPATATATRAA